MPRMSPAQWQRVEDAITPALLERHGLPPSRPGSVLIGTFNIRKLGSDRDRVGNGRKGRTPGAWQLLALACQPFDLVAIQEVQDELAGLRRLQRDLLSLHGRAMRLVVSDVAGSRPGGRGMTERMAFLYDPARIDHTELSAEITSDRAEVTTTLFERRADFGASNEAYAAEIADWRRRCAEAAEAGKRKPKKPWLGLPTFLTFIRAPHVASFRILATGDAEPIDLLAVNAHLLYGRDEDERLWEFLELVEWLALRAKYPDKLYAPNLLLLGDCNLETGNLLEAAAQEDPPPAATTTARAFLEWKIKTLNRRKLRSRRSADANFPLLDPHPLHGPLHTNARQDQTYDQIGLFCRDPRLPRHTANATVTGTGDGFDYGVFRFTDLVAEILEPAAWQSAVEARAGRPGSPFELMPRSVRKRVIGWLDTDVSDHLPAWIRLPRP